MQILRKLSAKIQSQENKFSSRFKEDKTLYNQYFANRGLNVFEDTDLIDLKPGSVPSVEEMNLAYGTIGEKQEDLSSLVDIVFTESENRFRYLETLLLGIQRQIKTISAKQAALSLWDNQYRYSINESFLSTENLDLSSNSRDKLSVHTTSGILTLPVLSQGLIGISDISIGSKSNGRPGNSDLNVSNTHQVLDNLVQDNHIFFEYERLDAGPLVLELDIRLPSKEIVNCINIIPIINGFSPTIVKDVLYHNDDGYVSIKNLISVNRNLIDFSLKDGTQYGWWIVHFPVVTNHIKIILQQDLSSDIVTARGSRKQYKIAIESIKIFQLKFNTSGTLDSRNIDLPEELFVGISNVDVFPQRADTDIRITTNQSASALLVNNGLSNDFQLVSPDFIYHIKMEKNLTQMNFDRVDSPLYEVVSRPIPKGRRPFPLSLNVDKEIEKINVLRGDIGIRSRSKKNFLAIATGTDFKVRIPIDINKVEIEDINIYCNGVLQTYEEDNSSLSSGQWSIDDELEFFVFPSTISERSRIEYNIGTEEVSLKKMGDKYFYNTIFTVTPNKNLTVLRSIPRNPIYASVLLPKNQKVIRLEHQNLDPDSIVLTSRNSTSYTSVSGRLGVLAVPNSYYIDCVNGFVFLNAEFDSDSPTLTYKHLTPTVEPEENYNFRYDSLGNPIGIEIEGDKFRGMTYQETVSGALESKFSLNKNRYNTKTAKLAGNDNIKELSSSSIIEGTVVVSDNLLNSNTKPVEIPFIDGESEFLGLMQMKDEKTNAITASLSDPKISFTLSAGGRFYKSSAIVFSDTTTFGVEVASVSLVNAAGKYYVSSEGEVTVYIGTGATLKANTNITYMFKDPEFDTSNKYSIDYKQGILYAYVDLESTGTITYSTALYSLDYNISHVINGWSYDSNRKLVNVDTTVFDNAWTTLTVIAKVKDKSTSSIDLFEYYSPIISSINFRFA
jgi:hypothetical protein